MRLRQDDLTWQEIDEEIIVLDLQASTYLRLNGTGAHLWKHLDQGADLTEMTQSLVDSYDVDADTARRDVDAFIRQLRRANLVSEDG